MATRGQQGYLLRSRVIPDPSDQDQDSGSFHIEQHVCHRTYQEHYDFKCLDYLCVTYPPITRHANRIRPYNLPGRCHRKAHVCIKRMVGFHYCH